MKKEKFRLQKLVRLALGFGACLSLALGLFVFQLVAFNPLAAWAAPLLQASTTSQGYPGSPTTAVNSDNIIYIIAIPVIVLLAAIGLGYTIFRLTRDSG
jgi:hypothetical protein